MSIYTYVVDHGKNNPSIGAGDKVNGGAIQSVMFDDGLKRLEDAEDFLYKLRESTSCNQTKYAIDEFLG